MDEEIEKVDIQMKEEISVIRTKYNKIKNEIRQKYKKTLPKKPRKSIPKTVKSDTWNKYIGKEKGIGKCECCSKEIDSKFFECGHVKSSKDGGEETVENLRPICGECNKSMGTENLYEFKKKHYPIKKEPKTYFQLEQEKAFGSYNQLNYGLNSFDRGSAHDQCGASVLLGGGNRHARHGRPW